MFYYLLEVAYNGYSFFGWQIQPELRTIQGELKKSLEHILQSEVKILGSSRTDTQVHALGQICKVTTLKPMDELKSLLGVNSQLPREIRVKSIRVTDEKFHPINDVEWKEYAYLLSNVKVMSPFQGQLIHNEAHPLDLTLMNEAAAMICGKHDFVNYYCTGSKVNTTVRTVFHSHWQLCEQWEHVEALPGRTLVFSIAGDGFLKQMIRLLVGGMIQVGRGSVSLEEFKHSLDHPLARRLGPTAPGYGLYLKHISFAPYPQKRKHP